MSRLAFAALSFTTAACVTTSTGSTSGDPDLVLAADEMITPTTSWDVAPTLHVGARVAGRAAALGRRIYPVLVAGSAAAPIVLDVAATAADGGDVRVAVLGPLAGDARPVLGAGGYAQPRGNVELTVEITEPGEHLIVVGSFDLARATSFSLGAYCDDCAPEQTDLLASPKDGALVATGDRVLRATLGDVMAKRDFDLELELWAAPPADPAAAELVATSAASGNQINVMVPAAVAAGDDLTLIVRDPASGAVLDAGVVTRFAPALGALVRTDALRYAEGGLGASGMVGLFEGRARLELRTVGAGELVADAAITRDRPGQVGNGWNAFDATFIPIVRPAQGDLLSIGTVNGNGDPVRLACFRYGAGPAACP